MLKVAPPERRIALEGVDITGRPPRSMEASVGRTFQITATYDR
jgi:hypothetical protein